MREIEKGLEQTYLEKQCEQIKREKSGGAGASTKKMKKEEERDAGGDKQGEKAQMAEMQMMADEINEKEKLCK